MSSKEYHREYNKKYFSIEENKMKRRKVSKAWYQENKEKMAAYQKEYYLNNKEKLKAYQKEYLSKDENIEKRKATRKIYRENPLVRERERISSEKYRLKKKEKIVHLF